LTFIEVREVFAVKDGSQEEREESIRSFVRSELPRQQNLEIVRRLLGERLPRPKAELALVRPDGSAVRHAPATDESRYDDAFRKVEVTLGEAQVRLEKEKQAASAQWSLLEAHPQARRQVMIRNDKRLQTWGLYDLLLCRSREIADREPRTAVALAELADTLAGVLDPEVYGALRITDFRAAALISLGNARRLAGDLTGARVAFQQARVHLEIGTGDPLEEAHLSQHLASLLCDLGEYEKAAHALERAATLGRRLGEPPLEKLVLPEREAEAVKPREGSRRA
jgi:tetratricopeptide (TPR) repeat protein